MIVTFLAVLDLAQRQAVRIVFGADAEDFARRTSLDDRARPRCLMEPDALTPDDLTPDTFDQAVEALVFASDVPLRAEDLVRAYGDVTGAEHEAADADAAVDRLNA